MGFTEKGNLNEPAILEKICAYGALVEKGRASWLHMMQSALWIYAPDNFRGIPGGTGKTVATCCDGACVMHGTRA